MVTTASLEMATLRWGETGPLVLLVHGFPDTARTWDALGPRVAAEGFRVIAPYTRGYAPSAVPADGKYDSDSLGRDLIELLDALGEDKAMLVGHDWGASACLGAAALYPERIERLATLAIPHPAVMKPSLGLLWDARHFIAYKLPGAEKRFAKNDFAALEAIYERWSPAFDWPDSEFESAKNSFSSPGCLDAAFGYYRALTTKLPPGMRKKIEVPSLVLGGKSDPIASEANFEDSRRRFTGDVQIKMVPGGHFLHREYPDDLFNALMPFLKASPQHA
ncbi:MAG: pimeloyl-ACP methyl ester carboxylesterase [Polyangiales bacterium]|jgi:pimeloyl-ACP methyl ester carboxylesterase